MKLRYVSFLSVSLAHVAKVFDGTRLRMSIPEQMLQRLSIALAQVKEVISKNLINKMCQTKYYLYQAKQITKRSIQQY